ncbi:tubulin gamma [Enteropsectra breve]|nr:tubulin gamma [Enteropsectra breve]
MHEIITFQVGQCGNQVGNEFWRKICHEHKINEEGIATEALPDRKDKFFFQTDFGRYVPRAMLIDLEPRALSQSLPIFSPDNVFTSNEGGGAGNNWANGYFLAKMNSERLGDMIQREVESCDNVEAMYLMHSIAGGTGSGFGSFLVQELKDRFPKKILTAYSILPTNDEASDVVVQPYNSVFTLNSLNQFCDSIVAMDNTSLGRAALDSTRNKNSSYNIINTLVSTVVSASNTTIRFPGYTFCDSRSILNGTVPVPSYKFLVPSYAPFSCDELTRIVRKTTVNDVMKRLILPKNRLCMMEPSSTHAVISQFNVLEGVSEPSEVSRALELQFNLNSLNFVNWMPPFFQTAISKREPEFNRVSGLGLCNSTGISGLLRKIGSQFDQLRRKNAFLEIYKKFDMEEQGFDINRENLQRLIEGYESCEMGSPANSG